MKATIKAVILAHAGLNNVNRTKKGRFYRPFLMRHNIILAAMYVYSRKCVRKPEVGEPCLRFAEPSFVLIFVLILTQPGRMGTCTVGRSTRIFQ